jgi:hypothetical protein
MYMHKYAEVIGQDGEDGHPSDPSPWASLPSVLPGMHGGAAGLMTSFGRGSKWAVPVRKRIS